MKIKEFFKVTKLSDLVGFLITGVAIFTIIAAIVTAHNVNAAPKAQAPVYAPVRSPQAKQQTSPQAQPGEDKQPERPFYGQTYYEGSITSVYFYPNGTDEVKVAATHIKFNHNEELDVWFCGDQRSKIKPGATKRRLLLSHEPNAACVTNWQLH